MSDEFERYRINRRTTNKDPRNSILTHTHRDFLTGDGSGYHEQTQRNHREAIKDRVHNAILDFSLLLEHWPEEDREEVFQETTTGELRDGLASFIALMYLENRFESGMQTLLFRGISKAEAEMADSDQNQVVKVDFAVEHLTSAEFEQAIEKFRRGRLSDMTDGETRAIVNMLRESRTVTAKDLEAMQGDIIDQLDEFKAWLGEARRQRAEYAREKQGRYRQADDDEYE